MPYTERQRRYVYAQAQKGVGWAEREVRSGKAKHLKTHKNNPLSYMGGHGPKGWSEAEMKQGCKKQPIRRG